MIGSERITLNSSVCHGKPCIRGLRYPVTMVLELLGAGMNVAEILADYPDLEAEDIQACLQFAERLSDVQSLPQKTSDTPVVPEKVY